MNAKPQLHQADVVVLGAGAAGLTAALSIPKHLSVAVLTKTLVEVQRVGPKVVSLQSSMIKTRSKATWTIRSLLELGCVIEMSWSMWSPAPEEQSIGSWIKVLSSRSQMSPFT